MRSDRRRKEFQPVLNLTGLDGVEAHVERKPGVGGRQLVTQENVDPLAQ
jgi:hypothetical protein